MKRVHTYRQTPGTSLTDPFPMFQNLDSSRAFFAAILNSAGGSTYNGTSLAQALPFASAYLGVDWAWEKQVKASDLRNFTTGMALMVNTYLQASQDYSAYRLDNVTVLQIFVGNKTAMGITWGIGSAKGASYYPQYHLSWPWLAIDITTCIILFVAAIICHWLRVHTVAPDVFGYVSSMTRDNPHLKLPAGGSAMSDIDRAKALKKVQGQDCGFKYRA